MAVQITMDLPESAFSALRLNPDTFAKEMLLAAAVIWYEKGMIPQSKAAEIAGMSRHAFLEGLARFGVSPFQVAPEELEEKARRG